MLNGQLLNYHNELTKWAQHGSVLQHLLHSKVNDFYHQYGVRIQSINDRVLAMQKKYFKHDDKGIPVTENVDGKDVLVCNEGMTQDEFNKEYIALMNMEVGKYPEMAVIK